MINNLEPQFIKLKLSSDVKGQLISLEENLEVPFQIKRIFYIFPSNNAIRGRHANKKSKFLFIPIKGSVKISYYFKSTNFEVLLNNPAEGFYLPELSWKQMYDFSSDSILLVITNTNYDPNEYIYNFEEYIKVVGDNESKI